MAIFILCLKIFFVRILDVSLGTVRTIITLKDKGLLASLIGFVEVLIWFLIVKEALNVEMISIWIAIAYAGGFAAGTYIGSFLSNKFIKGVLTVQVITGKKYAPIANKLREEGYAVSILDVKGKNEDEEKYMLFIEIDSKKLYHLQSLIKKLDADAFIVINESKYVFNGYLENNPK